MAEDESHLVQERRAKVARWRAKGREPYPHSFPRRILVEEVRLVCASLDPGASAPDRPFRVAGRLRSVRSHGRSSFLDIDDASGSLQLFLRVDELGEQAYREWLADLDPGDIIGADGIPTRTKRGEPSLLVRELTLLAKALAPPPEKFHGLKDPEERLRRRYVDLLSSTESRGRFRARTFLVSEIRDFFDGRGFLEVETPVLQTTASGALAEPFRTYSNYLRREVDLRISLELPLKRLLVGGLERVYELSKVFRNEDLDSTHSPEFTELEVYWAYADYNDMRALAEELLERLAQQAARLLPNAPEVQAAAAKFRRPFPTVPWVEEFERRSGISGILEKSRDHLRELARGVGATVADESPTGKFLDKLFEHYVEPHLQDPTFVVDFPAATTPLAKRHRSAEGLVERFELFARGYELGNAYTELNDPDEQERRFREQASAQPDDAYAYDAEFIDAMRYGMPPQTGFGLGVDRLLMAILAAESIKEVLLFLPMRPRNGNAAGKRGPQDTSSADRP